MPRAAVAPVSAAVVALLVALLPALAAPGTASAASCGKGASETVGDVTYSITQIRAAKVSCRTARAFAAAFQDQDGENAVACSEDQRCRFRRWSCRNTAASRGIDHRCTKGPRVIRWSYRFSQG